MTITIRDLLIMLRAGVPIATAAKVSARSRKDDRELAADYAALDDKDTPAETPAAKRNRAKEKGA